MSPVAELSLKAQEEQEQDRQLQAALKAVRDAETVVEKMALLLGAETLRDRLPAGLLASEQAELGGEDPAPERIAQMAYNAHGDGVLQVHAKDLQLSIRPMRRHPSPG